MATKPTPGASDGTYGTELNAFLDVSLAADGKVKTEALQTNATAPVADAAVANKKYVDDQITAISVKAWVVFDGTDSDPITKGAGCNISETITKNGTGDYTITWDTDFADGNYAISGVCSQYDTNQNGHVSTKYGVAPAAGSVRIICNATDGTEFDPVYVSVMAIGTQ